MRLTDASVRAGLRRIAIAYLSVAGLTVVVSTLLGLLAHDSVLRSIAVGLYAVGAVMLVGCLLFGARGPLRGVSQTGEVVAPIAARGLRRATTDERSEAARTAILLFVLAMGLIVVATLIDPAHKVI